MSHARRHVARGLQLLAIILTGAAATYAATALSPLQETMRHALSLSDNQIALLQGPALFLPSILAAVPLGYLIDRFPRSLLLALFAGLQFAASLLTAFAHEFLALFAVRVIIGLTMPAIAMGASALIGDVVGRAWRGRTLMLLGFSQVAGMALAFRIGGALAAHFGPSEAGWRSAMLLMSTPLLASVFVAACIREPKHSGAAREPGETSLRQVAARLWSLRGAMIPLAIGPVLVGIGYMASLVWAAPILARAFGLDPDRIGKIMSFALITSAVLGSFLGGLATDWIERTAGPRRLITLMLVLATLEIPAGFFGVSTSVPLFIVLLTSLSTMFFMKGIVCVALTIAVIPSELRGSCFGIQNTISGALASAAPLVVSAISASYTGLNGIGQAMTVVCLLTSIGGAAIFALGRRSFPVRETV